MDLLKQGSGWKNVAIPDAGFSWVPFVIQKKGRKFRVRPDWSVDLNRPTGKAYYVSTSGSDSNDGLTPSTALRKVVTAYGKSDVVEIRVLPGVYGLTNGIGTQNVVKNLSIIAEGGSVILGAFAEPGSLSFSLDATHTHTYKVTRSSVGAVWDVVNLTANGDYTQLTLRSSAAEVEANPGSWYLDGSNVLWIRRSDGVAVTDSNCRIIFSSAGRTLMCNAGVTLYCEGIRFEGGHGSGCVQIDRNTGTPVFYAKDCSFKYCTASSGFASTGSVTYLLRCESACNYDDGFNYHIDGVTLPYAVEIDCIGRDNGRLGDIDNASSMHDGGSIVRINGEYFRCIGRIIHDVGALSLSWNLGSYAHDPASASADINWSAGTAGSTAKMWLDSVRSVGAANDVESFTDCTVYLRGFSGDASNTGSGTITQY